MVRVRSGGCTRAAHSATSTSDFKVLALFVHNPGLIHTTFKRIVQPEDIKDQHLRAPNKTVAAALEALGATPVVLQVNDVMPAIKDHSLDGVVTNWGNPLPDFDEYLKIHTDIAFYTSAFFVVMNKARVREPAADVRAAIDKLSNQALVTRFGLLWNKWDRPVREGATASGHEIIVPADALLAQWHHALRPVADQYLDTLVSGGFAEARTAYTKKLVVATQHCRGYATLDSFRKASQTEAIVISFTTPGRLNGFFISTSICLRHREIVISELTASSRATVRRASSSRPRSARAAVRYRKAVTLVGCSRKACAVLPIITIYKIG